MKFKRRAVLFISVSAMAGIVAFFAGCSRGENLSDDFPRVVSQEVSNMDANSSGKIAQVGTPKLAAAAADSITYDWTIHPYAWDTACSSYVRIATVSCSDGYERVRVDTLTFFDASGGRLESPTLATVDSIHHVRHVTRDKGGNQLDITVDMHSTVRALDQYGGYTHVKNGTITGTYNGEQAITGLITNVTRNYHPLTHWQLFPESGTITADFPRRLYEVEFLGAGTAKLTVTNHETGKTRVVTINVEQL